MRRLTLTLALLLTAGPALAANICPNTEQTRSEKGSALTVAEFDNWLENIEHVCEASVTVTNAWDFTGGNLLLPNNATTCPTTDCDESGEFGRVCVDKDASSGAVFLVCEGTGGWVAPAGGGGGGAPTNAEYLVSAANGTLSAERVFQNGTNTTFTTGAGTAQVDVADATTGAKGVVQLAGDLGGTATSPSVVDDSHAHTTTTISGVDVSADTNLAVTAPVVLTDDTLSLNQNAGTDVTADLEEEAHASEHAENAADEILAEDLGTACTDGEILKADATGGVICGSAGSAAFTTLDADYGDETITSDFDFGGGTLQVPNSGTLPGTCEVGDSYQDTSADSGSQWYLCESTDTWVAQGGSGSATEGTTVGRSTTQSITQNVWTALGWDTESVDDAGWHDTVTNNSRITPDAGWVTLSCFGYWEGNTSATRYMAITKNGAPGTGTSILIDRRSAVSNNDMPVGISTTDKANGTDYYECYVLHDHSSALRFHDQGLSRFSLMRH